jgi:acetyl esterase
MQGLPYLWLGVGGADPLLEDTMALAEKLRRAGVLHEVKVYAGLPHAFVMLNRIFAGAALAIQDAARVARSIAQTSVLDNQLEA